MNGDISGDLPQGWTTTTVRDVIEDCQPGFASGRKDEEGGVRHLRMNNIGVRGEMVMDLVRRVPNSLARPQYELHRGDVLVCTTNSGKLVGKSTLFDLPGRYVFSNHLSRLRPRREIIDASFLRWNLWLQWQRGAFEDKCKHWVNQSSLPKSALLETAVALPPLAEQHRIVARLEELVNKGQRNHERLVRVEAILKRLRQSVLSAACSGRLTADWRERNSRVRDDTIKDLPAGWKAATVGDVIESLRYGTAQKCDYERRGVPVLRIPNVAKGSIDHADIKYARLSAQEREQLQLLPGDILLIRSNGSVSLVGRTALVGDSERGFAYAGYLIRLRAKHTSVLPEFLNLVLGTFDVRLQIELEARSTSGVHNINGAEARALSFSLPPLDEQREIIRRVKAFLTVADRMERRMAEAGAHVTTLTPCLLAKAFHGELVQTEAELAKREGREYESAASLLERLREKRETSLKPTTTMTGKQQLGRAGRKQRRNQGENEGVG